MTVTDTMLLAYVDGELDEAGIREVEQAVAADPQARRAVEMYRDTASLLRAACGEQVYAAGAQVLLRPAVAPTRMLPRRLAWAAAVSLVLGAGAGAGGTWFALQESKLGSLVDEIAEYHAVFSRETTHLAEVPASHAQELSAWLGQRLRRRVDIPDLATAGLQFAGGRMLVVDGAPIAQLMYTRSHGAPIAVCIGEMSGSERPVTLVQRGSLRLAVWRQGGYVYLVVGQMPAALARDLAGLVQVQMHG